MVVHGGFGFHVQDIAMRFGPDVLTVFFKVRELYIPIRRIFPLDALR